MQLFGKCAQLWLALIAMMVAHCQAQAVATSNTAPQLNSSAAAANAASNVAPSSPSGYRLYTKDDVFTVPWGKYNVRVLVVGGGGGGGSGHTGGGGSGYVVGTTLAVTPATVVPVRVGKGGAGAARNYACDRSLDACNEVIDCEDGGESSFGYTRAAGGQCPRGRFVGGNGGSGGGGGGGILGCDPTGTIGGFDGSDGANCRLAFYTTDYVSPKGGVGQGKGSFSSQFFIFRSISVTAGEPGAKISSDSWLPGTGGGGVKVGGTGPSGSKGANILGANGGVGYGGGGGAGGHNAAKPVDRDAGGKGAGGVVYVEWD